MVLGPGLRRHSPPQPASHASDITPGIRGVRERRHQAQCGHRCGSGAQDRFGARGATPRAGFSPAFAANGTAMFFIREVNGTRAAPSPWPGRPTGVTANPIVTVVADGARNYHPHPSPDGTQIAFNSDRNGEYLANADGTQVRRLSGPGYAAAPSWSPDGKRVAYVRAEDANPRVWNLWVHSIDEPTATRVTSYWSRPDLERLLVPR